MPDIPVRANLLGGVAAEGDRIMLDSAFFESPDYRTLIESAERYLVVGRRGAGKSALVYKLEQRLRETVDVVFLSPTEDQVIGLRPLSAQFGPTFGRQRAGARIGWRYALLMAIADALSKDYKVRKAKDWPRLEALVKHWLSLGDNFTSRLRRALANAAIDKEDADTRIAELASRLNVEHVTELVGAAVEGRRRRCVLLLDRLDEGYEPDLAGIGIVDGLVLAALELRDRIPGISAVVFLRDNVFRTIARWDPDYTRLIEGQVLRLHWDEAQLLSLVCNRLRVARGIKQENDLRVWNACTGRGLTNREGFRRCLQFTLYRPRDVILLLNQAFLAAAKGGRSEIIDSDIDTTAKEISIARLDDLCKEYTAVSPSVNLVASVFGNGKAEYSVSEAEELIGDVESRAQVSDPMVAQELLILESARNVLRELHSVGFLGIRDPSSGHFVFCHDGSLRDRELQADDRLLIHPCYWMALNLAQDQLDPDQAAEINDEYDIEVGSATPRIRAARLGQLIAHLGEIPIGTEGAGAFEEWCRDAIKIIFAKALDNVALHPNHGAIQRRDVVATNLAKTDAWRRIREDYGSRQVLFEIKNLRELGADEFRQILSYLTGDYGRLGFVLTRDDDEKPHKGRELDWIRELYTSHKVIVVKLTGKWLANLLGKLRSPQKHDAAERSINYLLDTYSRTFLSLPSSSASAEPRDARSRRRRRPN